MIKKTKTGLYTTTTKIYSATERVNVFQSRKEAIKSLNKYERVQYKIENMKINREHGMLLGLGIAYENKELIIFLPFTILTISKKQ